MQISLKETGLHQGNWQMLNSFDDYACDDYTDPIFLFRMHTFGQIPYLYLGDPKANSYELFNSNQFCNFPYMFRRTSAAPTNY